MDIRVNNLKDSNEFLNILLENINSAVFVVDKDIKIYSVNNSCKIMFNKPAEKMLDELCGNAIGCGYVANTGKNCGETEHCPNCKFRNAIIKTFDEKSFVKKQILERKFYINSGYEKRIYEFSTRYIHFEGEDMVVIIVDDITDLIQQKRNLEKINKEKDQLLSIASHDLRSPVSVLKMYSECILEDHADTMDPEVLDFTKSVNKRSTFLIELLSEILDLNKIESGIVDLNLTEIKYNNFVEEVIKLNRRLAKQKNIKIFLENNIKDLKIKIDKSKIEQVINNILSNAIKYSFKNKNIFIEITKNKKYIITKIKDQGQGIPEDEVNKIFDKFVTTSVKATDGETSTGLGLAIVKKIIEVHHGKIKVSSKFGEGSTFTFYLPIKR
ncbi:MAG: ATP-binding protein [Fusobacteriota bacterium]